MKFKHQATLLFATISASLAVAALIAAPAQAAPTVQPPHATSVVVDANASPSTVSPNATDWLIWDGNHITSLSNCQARLSFLRQTYPGTQFRCSEYEEPRCPSPIIYWMVESREIGRAALQPDAKLAAMTQRAPAVAAC